MTGAPYQLEAPLDTELLADLVEAVEAGRAPTQAALEEVAALVEARPSVLRELRRRRALRTVEAVRAENPGASRLVVARIVARRLGESAETVRWWARGVDSPSDLGEPDARKEP